MLPHYRCLPSGLHVSDKLRRPRPRTGVKPVRMYVEVRRRRGGRNSSGDRKSQRGPEVFGKSVWPCGFLGEATHTFMAGLRAVESPWLAWVSEWPDNASMSSTSALWGGGKGGRANHDGGPRPAMADEALRLLLVRHGWAPPLRCPDASPVLLKIAGLLACLPRWLAFAHCGREEARAGGPDLDLHVAALCSCHTCAIISGLDDDGH